jgi:hypothetical protein
MPTQWTRRMPGPDYRTGSGPPPQALSRRGSSWPERHSVRLPLAGCGLGLTITVGHTLAAAGACLTSTAATEPGVTRTSGHAGHVTAGPSRSRCHCAVTQDGSRGIMIIRVMGSVPALPVPAFKLSWHRADRAGWRLPLEVGHAYSATIRYSPYYQNRVESAAVRFPVRSVATCLLAT